MEWGVSKSVCKEADLGVVGYYQRQVTANSDKDSLNSVAAVGPEVSFMFPKQMLFVSLRYNYEFMAKSRAQGNDVTLTLPRRSEDGDTAFADPGARPSQLFLWLRP